MIFEYEYGMPGSYDARELKFIINMRSLPQEQINWKKRVQLGAEVWVYDNAFEKKVEIFLFLDVTSLLETQTNNLAETECNEPRGCVACRIVEPTLHHSCIDMYKYNTLFQIFAYCELNTCFYQTAILKIVRYCCSTTMNRRVERLQKTSTEMKMIVAQFPKSFQCHLPAGRNDPFLVPLEKGCKHHNAAVSGMAWQLLK